MTDAEQIAKWGEIDDLPIAVAEFIENQIYVSDDPYYRDVSNALWAMLERAYAKWCEIHGG